MMSAAHSRHKSAEHRSSRSHGSSSDLARETSGRGHSKASVSHESTAAEAVQAVYHTPFPLTGGTVIDAGWAYRLANKHDCMTFRNFADSLDGFTLRFDNKETIVWDKKVKGEKMNIIKVFGFFENTAPSVLYDMLQDSVFRCEWDEYRLDAFRITLLNEKNDIGYYAVKAPTGVSNRDFVNQRMWHSAGNGEYVIFNTTVFHPTVPVKKAFVRAISKVSGYLIRPWGKEINEHGESKGACLTYITQTDPCGWIPSTVTNYVTTKYAPNTISNVSNASIKFKEWLPKQTAYEKDWEAEPEPYDEPVKHETIDFVLERWGHAADAEKKKAK